MFEKIKKQLYQKKTTLLFNQGLINKKIVPFDEEFYEKMSHTFFNGLPISLHIKYLKPLPGMPGECYDRSLFMFFCFPESLLCRGFHKTLELDYGKENEGHGWIEIGDYVYDPSLLMKFDKELYYSIYMPTNIKKYTISQYCSTTERKKLYDDITKTTIYDLQTPGIKRTNFIATIPLVKNIAEMSANQDFIRALNEHLTLINYDEKQISRELNLVIKKHN